MYPFLWLFYPFYHFQPSPLYLPLSSLSTLLPLAFIPLYPLSNLFYLFLPLHNIYALFNRSSTFIYHYVPFSTHSTLIHPYLPLFTLQSSLPLSTLKFFPPYLPISNPFFPFYSLNRFLLSFYPYMYSLLCPFLSPSSRFTPSTHFTLFAYIYPFPHSTIFNHFFASFHPSSAVLPFVTWAPRKPCLL